MHEAFRKNQWQVLAVGAAVGPLSEHSSTDTLAGLGRDAGLRRDAGLDWRPPQGRILRAGDRVVPATTRRGLDVLMTGVQPPPGRRRGESTGR
ncbi:hypothetical protein [Streptomyces sp. ATCC 21386]|uniref:hypothetical protein n=1 Tax=Streptomyces sp. ATCC 21386 TaxID=2699428 RepID=UPI001BFF34B1|nr:hypothetical protein [Streptomyces sp. ATCC 21386]